VLSWKGSRTPDNSAFTELELGTIISGKKILYMDYGARSPNFSTFVPTALKIIDR
jgi:hypothetical protein